MRVQIQKQNDASADCFTKQLLDMENGKMTIDELTQCITLTTNFCKIAQTTVELIDKVLFFRFINSQKQQCII